MTHDIGFVGQFTRVACMLLVNPIASAAAVGLFLCGCGWSGVGVALKKKGHCYPKSQDSRSGHTTSPWVCPLFGYGAGTAWCTCDLVRQITKPKQNFFLSSETVSPIDLKFNLTSSILWIAVYCRREMWRILLWHAQSYRWNASVAFEGILTKDSRQEHSLNPF